MFGENERDVRFQQQAELFAGRNFSLIIERQNYNVLVGGTKRFRMILIAEMVYCRCACVRTRPVALQLGQCTTIYGVRSDGQGRITSQRPVSKALVY